MSQPSPRTSDHQEKGMSEKSEFTHRDYASSTVHDDNTTVHRKESTSIDEKTKHAQYVNAKLANPLMGKSKAEIVADVNEWTREYGIEDLAETFRKGALVAANPGGESFGVFLF